MPEWRVTKYDPTRRDAAGAFLDDDWTSANDIGRTFAGRALTLDEYLGTEDRYVEAALGFFDASRVPRLVVEGLEPVGDVPPAYTDLGLDRLLTEGPPLVEGDRLDRAGVARALRLMLRDLCWMRLEAPGRFFLHVGWDYYLYIGSRADLPHAVAAARALGLYVELFDSPYAARLGD